MEQENSHAAEAAEAKENMEELEILVKNHANKMRTPANNERGKCVDGGYRAGEAEGALALPGGHIGLAMNLIAMDIPAETALEMTMKFLKDRGIAFGWHSDTHEGHGCTVGCGHWNAAMLHPEEYVAEDKKDDEAEIAKFKAEVTKLFKMMVTLRDDEEQAKEFDYIELAREHAEQAILVVTSEDFTVKPWNEDDDVQFFIYDKNRHEALLESMVDEFGFEGAERERFMKIVKRQTEATLGLLGSSKGKPMFEVDVSVELNPVVQLVGYAPVIEK